MAKRRGQILTGFDTNTGNGAGRLFDRNGQPNVIRTGASFSDKFSMYHTLINMPFKHYLALILVVYFIINLVFASIYYALGPSSLGVENVADCDINAFGNCFFFSAQTLTTVGYGRLSPNTFSSSTISAIESLLGLLLFAVITGLSYARFARPESKIIFSKNILVAPYEGGKAIMFRLVSPTKHLLNDAEMTVTLAILEEKNGRKLHQFYTLELEAKKAVSLPLNWTIVHALTEDSPLYNIPVSAYETLQIEFLVFFKAYDENYSNHVQQRTSYTSIDLVENAKFVQMFQRSDDGFSTVLEIDKLSKYDLLAS